MLTRRPAAAGFVLALGIALVAAPGCASFEAARLYRSGTRALDRGDTGVAIRDLERATEVVPYASPLQNHLGLAYAAAGRNSDALAAFRRAVELDCENGAAQENLLAAEAQAR